MGFANNLVPRDLIKDLGEYYPGSKERRQVRPPDEPGEEPLDLGKPWVLEVAGYDVEFYPIGVLARALNRSPVTIRAWEKGGILPTSWAKTGKDKDPRGRRRLYTRKQIEGVVQIAREEGVLDPHPRCNITATDFTRRVSALFKQLREEGFR
jgi:hypothetical protein